MNHLGLFEGIGGFSLAARWMGWETLAWCEWNEFAQKVLRHHFPESEGFGDITKTDFTKYANKIDIITGGFPCQPYSVAGLRKGSEDERHLWPHMLRAIGECHPKWVVGENVPGLVSWNDGMVYEQIHADLEEKGYEVQSFIIPSNSVGADHERKRIWFVAHMQHERIQRDRKETIQGIAALQSVKNGGGSSHFRNGSPTSEYFYRGVSDGIPTELYNECISRYGNAIVPQVAYQIFKAIQQYHE